MFRLLPWYFQVAGWTKNRFIPAPPTVRCLPCLDQAEPVCRAAGREMPRLQVHEQGFMPFPPLLHWSCSSICLTPQLTSWFPLNVFIKMLSKDWQCRVMLAWQENPMVLWQEQFKGPLWTGMAEVSIPRSSEAARAYLLSIYPSTITLDRQIHSKRQTLLWISH